MMARNQSAQYPPDQTSAFITPQSSEATADSVIKRPPGLILPQLNLCLILHATDTFLIYLPR